MGSIPTPPTIINISMANILISGDSWACGEWGKDPYDNYCVLHSGIQRFLQDAGHTVKNIGGGSLSNKNSIERLQRQNLDLYDFVFWIQTDPIRDLRPYSEDLIKDIFLTYDSVVSHQSKLLDLTYERLNALNKKIYCMGGCFPLEKQLITKYNNLIPFIKSIILFLEPRYNLSEVWFSDWLHLVDRQFNLSCIDKFLVQKRNQDSLETYKKYFWPDGGHANRTGHKILYDYIVKHLIEA